jgi:hypothetical protein
MKKNFDFNPLLGKRPEIIGDIIDGIGKIKSP